MNLEKNIAYFTEYANNFDMNVEEIKYKYNHTLRVVDFAREIIANETNDNLKINLAITGALLHDIARFKEWSTYHSWKDIDHGDLGYEILTKDNFISKFVSDDNKDVVLKAVKYHNKKLVPDNLSKLEELVLNVVRDADKIDILNTQYNNDNVDSLKVSIDDTYDVKDEILQRFLKEEQIDYNLVSNHAEYIIYYLSYLFDFNFRTSFKIVYNFDMINEKLKLLKSIINEEDKYKIIKIKILDYLESNIKL